MEFRTINGTGNNLVETDLNTPGTAFVRLGPARYADGVSAMVDGPNPRTVSNLVVGEGEAATPNQQGLSGMMYAWGQFIDHDLTLGAGDRRVDGLPVRIDIAVPPGDPVFPDGSIIPLTRVGITAGSGTDAEHPAIAANTVTGWLDASMVYGSNAAVAASLRLPDGHMKRSDGGNLPMVDGRFAAGDVRAGENPSLTSLQTLFVREHNYQVDRLQAKHPDLSGNQLYEMARSIVAAEIAHITYAEFLPHLLGRDALAPYAGYDPNVDPRPSVEFAGAAYRWGHSTVSAETERKNEAGEVTGPALELRDAFFMPPAEFAEDGGAGGFLRHLATDLSQAMDARIVVDLRNFLFDPPVGLDLAAINIQRGRDLGLGTLNETRMALGLEPYTDFDQITDDAATVEGLRMAFGTPDEVDLWTGGLSEGLAPGAFLGITFSTILTDQFERLRDGDRLWYRNQGFDPETLAEIEGTQLSDIILRNTDTAHIQDDVFVFFERRGSKVEPEHAEAPQLVIGSDGRSTLMGGPMGDILVAGRGRQTLTGGEGDDRFVLTASGRATITDFQSGHDTVKFDQAGNLSFADLDIRERHGHTIVRLGEYRADLMGVQPDDLSPRDFLFA
jgi:hypothetical protein